MINFFLELKESVSLSQKIIAVGEILNTVLFQHNNKTVPHLHVVQSRVSGWIPAEWIKQKCIFIEQYEGSTSEFIARPFEFCNLSV